MKLWQGQALFRRLVSMASPTIFFFNSIVLIITPAWIGSATAAGFGKSLAEISSLAKKEGKVRFTFGTPDSRQAKAFFKSFRDRHPGIDVEYTRAMPRTAAEHILAELLAGQVDFGLLTVLDLPVVFSGRDFTPAQESKIVKGILQA